ncbi:hypothetical protein HDU76_009948 [Blyttiomyces sp. JEL0837]|nr:hypothetical protein HDU76_009948 [Blyttiomyces sp. JEL0837]
MQQISDNNNTPTLTTLTTAATLTTTPLTLTPRRSVILIRLKSLTNMTTTTYVSPGWLEWVPDKEDVLLRLLEISISDKRNMTLADIQAQEADRAGWGYSPYSILHRAAESGMTRLATRAIELGADVNASSKPPRSMMVGARAPPTPPLFVAACKGHLKMAELLISHGARLSVPEDPSQNALLLAARFGQAEMVKYLAKIGGESLLALDDQQQLERCPLIQALTHYHPETVEVLLDLGYTTNRVLGGFLRRTPLHICINSFGRRNGTAQDSVLMRERLLKCVELLVLKGGADVNAGSIDGTPLKLAKTKNLHEVAELLERLGGVMELQQRSRLLTGRSRQVSESFGSHPFAAFMA